MAKHIIETKGEVKNCNECPLKTNPIEEYKQKILTLIEKKRVDLDPNINTSGLPGPDINALIYGFQDAYLCELEEAIKAIKEGEIE